MRWPVIVVDNRRRVASSDRDRLSANDRTVLATDHGAAPMNIAAVLEFDADRRVSVEELYGVLSERIRLVPRLRQRLEMPRRWGIRVPMWVEDPQFAPGRHLRSMPWPTASTRAGLLELAADLACLRLPSDRPLWRAVAVVRPDGAVGALILVMHHVLTDGLGALAILGALADRHSPPPAMARLATASTVQGSPRVEPPGQHGQAAKGGRRTRIARAAAGLRELGVVGTGHLRLAEPIWLNAPTGSRRRAAVVEVPLADVVRAAHRAGGTVNDVVLTAVTGAMLEAIQTRAERPKELVVSVPVSGRAATTVRELGNDTGLRPVAVPSIPDPMDRLAAVVDRTRRARATPRAASSAPLGATFRLLARLGLFGWFVDHQRLVHTFETNLRGPTDPIRIAGTTVTSIVPITVSPGNVAVSFAALSYAGTLGVTVVVDPEVVGSAELVTDHLSSCLQLLCHARAATA